MLGNWSFGDYFKTDAISWAWELLTEVYKVINYSLTEMGDTGPCGPCTEIHFDGIDYQDAASLCNSEADGSLKPLPLKHVNTGMGFGRLTWILQNKNDQNDTDVFMPIFNVIQQATRAKSYYYGKVGEENMWTKLTWLIVAEQIRALCFAVANGSRPDNKGREYVLRRILSQGVRYGCEVLKGQELKQDKVNIRYIIAEEK
ncbi:hypothetical protein MKX03_035940 [Papaver bracteatum]|nr:hypothetical protein MKX03_035940 [Papaver bracteatum]